MGSVLSDQDDLQKLKIYRVLSDNMAAQGNLIRVVDDSGEDYLYPEKWFVPIELPPAIRRLFKH